MTKQHAVAIAGGGPTGMMLAAELALSRIDVAIVERRESQALASSRAGGLHSRTIEVLDQRGVAERFLSQGKVMQVAGFAMIPLDISDFPIRHNYGLALKQNHIERILASWVEELSIPVYRGREVTGFAQDDTGVDIALAGGDSLRAHYLVGCDGGRSVIRKKAGVAFPGWDPSVTYLIAEVDMAEEPAWGFRNGERGVNALGKLDDGKRVGIVLVEPRVVQGDEPTIDQLREALIAVYGEDFGVHNVTWLSRFSDMARQAASYDLGEGHPLLGRRMPDLDLVTEGGPRRVFTLLHAAEPVLLNLGQPDALDIGPWADRVRSVNAQVTGLWELPLLGAVTAPTAVLIRPDGHVAWVGDGTDHGLRDALVTWFGPPPNAAASLEAPSTLATSNAGNAPSPRH